MKYPLLYLPTLLLTSCTSVNYYQLYKVSSEHGTLFDDNIVFEDKNCKVLYNLWADGGDAGFYIYNKIETDIQIDLTKSFFVLNGVSYEYFQNRTFTESSGISRSTSFEENPNTTIPPKTMTKISEFHVSNSRYTNCDLPKFPTTKTIKTIKFEKTDSPFNFYNLISYTIENKTERLENKFFVSEVTNLPEANMITTTDKSLCGNKLDTPVKIFKDVSPDKFYIKYIREN